MIHNTQRSEKQPSPSSSPLNAHLSLAHSIEERHIRHHQRRSIYHTTQPNLTQPILFYSLQYFQFYSTQLNSILFYSISIYIIQFLPFCLSTSFNCAALWLTYGFSASKSLASLANSSSSLSILNIFISSLYSHLPLLCLPKKRCCIWAGEAVLMYFASSHLRDTQSINI